MNDTRPPSGSTGLQASETDFRAATLRGFRNVVHLASISTQDLHHAHDIHTRNNLPPGATGMAYRRPGNGRPTPKPTGIYVARDASTSYYSIIVDFSYLQAWLLETVTTRSKCTSQRHGARYFDPSSYMPGRMCTVQLPGLMSQEQDPHRTEATSWTKRYATLLHHCS